MKSVWFKHNLIIEMVIKQQKPRWIKNTFKDQMQILWSSIEEFYKRKNTKKSKDWRKNEENNTKKRRVLKVNS